MLRIKDIYEEIMKNGNNLFLNCAFISAIETKAIFEKSSKAEIDEIDEMYLNVCSLA